MHKSQPVVSVQETPTGLLMQEYREVLLRLGSKRDDTALEKRSRVLEEEINRRIAW